MQEGWNYDEKTIRLIMNGSAQSSINKDSKLFDKRYTLCDTGSILRNIEKIDQLSSLKNKFNLVISDLAPNLSGISSIDEENILELNLLTLEGATKFLDCNGVFIVKTFQNSNLRKFRKEMEKNLKIVQTAKPAASKKQSKEIYLYGIK